MEILWTLKSTVLCLKFLSILYLTNLTTTPVSRRKGRRPLISMKKVKKSVFKM